MRLKFSNIIIFLVLCGFVFAMTQLASNVNFSGKPNKSSEKIADFSYTDMNGVSGNLYSVSGQAVIIHFWATWCPPCIEELPALLDRAHREKGVKFILVSVDKDEQQVINFLKPYPARLPNVISIVDTEQSISSAMKIAQFPETLIVNSDLTIRKHLTGAVRWKNYPL